MMLRLRRRTVPLATQHRARRTVPGRTVRRAKQHAGLSSMAADQSTTVWLCSRMNWAT